MNRTRRRRGLSAIALVLALGSAACSDDGSTTADTEAPDTTTPTSATSAATTTPESTPETFAPADGEPIKIGTTIWTLERIGFGVRLPGVQAGIEYVNSHGGVNGRPLEWVYCPAADANEGEACARKMVDEGVVATVADANFAAESIALSVLSDAGIPVIDPFLGLTDGMNDPNVYLMCGPTIFDYSAVVAYMHELGMTKMFTLNGASTQADAVKAVVDQAVAYWDVDSIGKVDVPLSSSDYLSQMQAAADADADVNLAVIPPFQTAQLLQAADQLGVPGRFGLQEGQFNQGDYQEYGQAGGALDGSLLVSCVPPFSAADEFPAVADALAAFATYYEESGDVLASPDKLTTLGLQTYFATLATAEAMRTIGDAVIDGASVKAALDASEGIDVGLSKPWVPSAPGPEGYSRVSNTFVYLCKVENGTSVLYQSEPIDGSEPLK